VKKDQRQELDAGVVGLFAMPPSWRAAGCKTASVSYHESFWVTVGTAAPVIALASIVSTSDAFGRVVARTSGRDLSAGGSLPRVSYYLASFVLTTQMFILGLALASLANGRNVIRPVFMTWAEPAALLILGIATIFNSTRKTHEAQD
jgi:hypothetical protein